MTAGPWPQRQAATRSPPARTSKRRPSRRTASPRDGRGRGGVKKSRSAAAAATAGATRDNRAKAGRSSPISRTIVLFLGDADARDGIGGSPLFRLRAARGRDERLEGVAGSSVRLRVAQQAPSVVAGQHHSVEVMSELLRVQAPLEMALAHP